jgi:hypothetical protein
VGERTIGLQLEGTVRSLNHTISRPALRREESRRYIPRVQLIGL